MNYVGRSVLRVEDLPLLQGAGNFAGDISLSNQLFMRIVRSSLAFGRLVSIETEMAEEMPGVKAVWTRDDVGSIGPIDFRQVRIESLLDYRQFILAKDFVRYVGEPVAAVFAEDPYLAEDAAEMVFPDIEELTPTVDAAHPEGKFDDVLGTEAALIEKSYGEVETAFQDAHHVVEMELAVGRQSGSPLETRGLIANYKKDEDLLEVYGASKIPHINRDSLAKLLSIQSERIHLYEGHVGGGFGIRGEIYPEDVLVCLAAIRLQQPIKWIEDRREHLIAANQSRGQVHKVRAAVDQKGFITGIDDEFWADQGAYVRTHAATVPELTASMLPGPYIVPSYRSVGHIRLTNKTPAGTYRAPGRFEGTFVRERLIDEIAKQLKMDPVDVRRANFIPPQAMPFDRKLDAIGTNVVYDSGLYESLLNKLLEHVDYAALRQEIDARRLKDEQVGLGLAYFVEKSGLGPFDDVLLELDETGALEVITGTASVGQGVETILAQICADALSICFDKITVIHGQTNRITRGMGAFASRVSVMTGSAVHIAANQLKNRILNLYCEMVKVDPDNVIIDNGVVQCNDSTIKHMTFSEIVKEASVEITKTGDRGKVLSVQSEFNTSHMTYPYGVHLVVAKIDKETAMVILERIVVAYDVGRSINPLLVKGQIVGGVAQGIGGALLEEFIYDEGVQPLATSFMDYLMPTVTEVPNVEVIIREDAPSETNPLGIKGAGEGGITGVGGAVANAISDALDSTAVVNHLPLSPNRVYDLLKDKGPVAEESKVQ
ncbi:MAG: xanthine dehydrogenase [Acidiferrobacteraceae bacterium]|nr:xanthine dehydrogenase [Acidiferrobacteraceae bacterium]|tara:strand:+ start:26447 stop:28765 length:2319 start_codon:yes stop_codon:yes gene_type:complete